MTVRFTVAGVTSFRCAFGMRLALTVPMTVRTMTLSRNSRPSGNCGECVSYFELMSKLTA